MSDWLDVLKKIAPNGKQEILSGIAAAMPGLIETFKLSNINRVSRFLGQWAEETDGYRVLEEYASGQAYEGRKDLGNVRAGDGRRFKGRALPMLTGRGNYRKYGKRLGVDLEKDPECAKQFPYAIELAAFYWDDHHLNELADAGNDRGLTKRINGGLNGFIDRLEYTKRAVAALSGQQLEQHPHYDPDAWPRSKMASLQTRLTELGYHPGKSDGRIGSGTHAAISAFQHDHMLPITGVPDEATALAIWDTDELRPISDDRANGKPEESKILGHLGKAATGGAIAIGASAGPDVGSVVDALNSVPDALNKAEQAKSYWDRISALTGGLGSKLEAWVLGHPLQVIAAVAVVYLGWKIWCARKERILDFQNWKTA